MKTLTHIMFIVILLGGSIQPVFAQSRLGIKAGLNLSDIHTSIPGTGQENVFQTAFGYHAGIFLILPRKGIIGFRPELEFTRKGGREKTVNNITIHLNYIGGNALLIFYPGEVVQISLGPQLAYLISSQTVVGSSSNSISVGRDYNRVELSLAIGGALDFDNMEAGIRAYWGLSNAQRGRLSTSAVPWTDDVQFRNSVLQVYLALKL